MSTAPRPNFSPLLHTVSQTVAFPHGYTLLIFGTTMITTHVHGAPDPLSIVAMLVGACVAYTTVGLFAKRGTGRLEPGQHRLITAPFVVATANLLTLLIATGACASTAYLLPEPHLAWLVTGLLGTTVYMLGITVQAYTISRRLDRH